MPDQTPDPLEAAREWIEIARQATLDALDAMPRQTKQEQQAYAGKLEEYVRLDARHRAVLDSGLNPESSREPTSSPQMRSYSHPAIDAAVSQTLKIDEKWQLRLGQMTDDNLRDSVLQNSLSRDIASGRLDPDTTLKEFKADNPNLVSYVNQQNRETLERKVTLNYMVKEKHFSISKTKRNHDIQQNPEILKKVTKVLGKEIGLKGAELERSARSVALNVIATKKVASGLRM